MIEQAAIPIDSAQITTVTSPIARQNIITGFRKELIEFRFRMTILAIAIRTYRNPLLWLSVPKKLREMRRKALGEHRIFKIASVGGRYYWGLYIPGWNSLSFRDFITAEMNRIVPTAKKSNRFTNAYVAVTKKCALQCEHCYEWENLNKRDMLSAGQLKSIIAKIQDAGVSQIHLSGGEPMLKLDLVLQLLESAKKGTDFWLLTSGLRLTIDAAKRLKAAGLNGVIVSLDHYQADEHNKFRGFQDSYYWVVEAVKNAVANNLVVSLSVCATRSFATAENLKRYLELARELGVSFVQILEPRAVGHFSGKDVSLTSKQLLMLEEFYQTMNYDMAYRDYPIISYHGYHQRRIGCHASGERSFYVDTDGDVNACPFCQGKCGNVLDDFDASIETLKHRGCHEFSNKNC